MKNRISVFFFVCIVLSLLWGCTKSEPTVSTAPLPPRFNYYVDRISGETYIIVIDPSNRNEKDLRSLAITLRNDTKTFFRSYAMIYDSKKAADMFPNVFELSPTDGAYYDAHCIAMYSKNKSTNHEDFTICLNGLTGKWYQIGF